MIVDRMICFCLEQFSGNRCVAHDDDILLLHHNANAAG